jgi:uncharacterized repeat protein (TIGR03803 family)
MRATTGSILGMFAVGAIAASSSASASSYRVLYSFQGGSDGANPESSLIMVNGTLYGTTVEGGGDDSCEGGPNGCGTVFSLNPATGAETVVFAFGFNSNISFPTTSLITAGGMLYGAATHSVYSVNLATGAETGLYFLPDSIGLAVRGRLLRIGNTLYATAAGSANRQAHGAVFSVNRKSGDGQAVYIFQGNGGRMPEGGVINVGGMLYGTTNEGGAHKVGTIFTVNPTTGAESILYSFGADGDGANPITGLLNIGGTFYGTTTAGGATGGGTVFAFNPATDAETVVYSFQGGKDGANPVVGVTEARGRLYGTTVNGGAAGYGTVFRVDPATGAERVVYSFKDGTDGAYPTAGLVNAGGTLYGTTTQGGDAACYFGGCGIVFSYTP